MLSRRDPLTKLAIAFLLVAWTTLTRDPARLAGLCGLLGALLIVVERIPVRSLLRGLVPFLFFALTSSWIYAVAPNPNPGSGAQAGWEASGLVAARIVATGMVSMAFALTTNPSDLARAMVHRAGVSRRFAYGTLAAVQFLPALAEDARIARLIARGAVEPGRGWTALRRAVAGLSFGTGVMLLAGAIRRAGAAALAMELRGLSADRPASAWKIPRATLHDGVLAACAILLVLALTV